jgi:hypothetical protein
LISHLLCPPPANLLNYVPMSVVAKQKAHSPLVSGFNSFLKLLP